MQSSNSVLSFYFDMLFVYDIQHVKDSFIGNSTLQANGYSYLQDHNYYLKDEMVEDNGTMPVFVTEIIGKDDFLERLITFENRSIYNLVESSVASLEELEEKKEFLNSLYDDFKILFRRVSNTISDSIELVEDSLTELLRDLKEKNINIIGSHAVFSNLHKDIGASYFRCLESLKPSFFGKLFEVTCSIGLIDEIEVYKEDFVEAFTCPKPQELSTKVKFIVQAGVVAHYFEAIKPFFHNFTNSTMELSDIFRNSSSKPYSANGIQKSKSLSKGKHLEIKTTIDLQINKLKKQFIK
ncbi:hypothetical protein [Algibacter lectus]|uniref:hypothetical protein n=1 Tax=Algibacter lectus TaxID=221126 RepID=UPI002494AD05|nr:hypothetical protein [Algibacter lectus]